MRIDWDSGTIKRDIGTVGSWSPPGLLEQEQGRQQWPREKCQYHGPRDSVVSIWRKKREQKPYLKPTKSGLGGTQSWRLKQQYWDGFTATNKMHQNAIYIYTQYIYIYIIYLCIYIYTHTYTNKYIVRGRVQKEIYRRLSDMVTLGSRLTISNHTQEC